MQGHIREKEKCERTKTLQMLARETQVRNTSQDSETLSQWVSKEG